MVRSTNEAARGGEERTLAASDFHLRAEEPGGVEAFCAFMRERVAGASRLFILGDLFDIWIGPAQLAEPGLGPAVAAMRAAAAAGTRITILRGNRDFLLGAREGKALGAAIGGGSLAVTAQGRRILLAHGDSFCTLDLGYQRMKRFLRSRAVVWLVRCLPAALVRRLARRLRRRSGRAVAGKDRAALSIQVSAVEAAALAVQADAVVCGHVHASSECPLSGGRRLFVLSEWSCGRGTYAEIAAGAIRLREFSAGTPGGSGSPRGGAACFFLSGPPLSDTVPPFGLE